MVNSPQDHSAWQQTAVPGTFASLVMKGQMPIKEHMGRRLRGKDYLGCLIQLLQVVTGVIAIIVFVR